MTIPGEKCLLIHTTSFPQSTSDFVLTPAAEIAQRLKLYSALLMFQAGQLSAGAACEFAEVDRYTFLTACKRHNIAVVDYEEDELEADFKNLKKTRRLQAAW